MERSMNTLSDQMSGARAPRPPQPGHGVGNVPFAPGMISGKIGDQGSPATPRPAPIVGQPGGPSPAAPSGPPGQGPPPMGPPGMGGGPPLLDPMFMFSVYNSLMQAYLEVAKGDGLPWGYS